MASRQDFARTRKWVHQSKLSYYNIKHQSSCIDILRSSSSHPANSDSQECTNQYSTQNCNMWPYGFRYHVCAMYTASAYLFSIFY